MLKKEYEILKPFAEKPWKKFTFREIKELSKKKSESYVYNSLKSFVKADILKEESAGNAILYSLMFSNLKAQAYVGMAAEFIGLNARHIPQKDISQIASKIPARFYILLITGSYANNKQTKNSDIDLVIICEDEPKKIYAELRHDCEMNIPKIHLYIFKEQEFIEMLLNNKPNYGKEIVNNNLILAGGESYFRIIWEAVKNGFNG